MPSTRRGLVLGSIVAVVLVAVGVTALALGSPARVDLADAGAPVLVDTFERAGESPSLVAPQGDLRWTSWSGTWGIRYRRAFLHDRDGTPPQLSFTGGGESFTAPLFGLATLPAPDSAGSVSVGLPRIADNCGLAFRVRDDRNFWAVVPVSESATWNIYRIQDGVADLVGNTGLTSTSSGTRATVFYEGETFRVMIDSVWQPARDLTTVADPFLADEQTGGLVALSRCGGASWSNFVYAG